MFLYNYFNPHFRKGSDGDLQSATNIIAISIHTSAREVTPFPLPDDRACRFQSTLPQGKWPALDPYLDSIAEISIHTSAREVTGFPLIALHSTLYFNPHFRKGSDRKRSPIFLLYIISIHTSAREVTEEAASLWDRTGISIHTSAREVTLHTFRKVHFGVFQSTLPQGKWLLHLHCRWLL